MIFSFFHDLLLVRHQDDDVDDDGGSGVDGEEKILEDEGMMVVQ